MQFNAASKVHKAKPIKPFPKVKMPEHNGIVIPKVIGSNEISVVIPVKSNQSGIDRLLKSVLDNVEPQLYPKEIIIVDNNSIPATRITSTYPFNVKLVKCSTPGPAAARNAGVSQSSGSWILFTDSDCVFTDSLIGGYLTDECDAVAFAGTIRILEDDYLSKYYREQHALHPLAVFNPSHGMYEPWCLVTANCLVLKAAFEAAGGFNESFSQAGGEDTDFGIRVRHLGPVKFNSRSEAIHDFSDGFNGFIKRYIRYGKGNKMLEELYDIDFWPEHFTPNVPSIRNRLLAVISVEAMRWGYRFCKR